MSHRVRSRTVDSADGKKPRRLTEKIAIMKKREHEQSEAFEHAMKSIYEMQQARRIHSGGGSMPSLQAIDATPPSHGMDMQVGLQDYSEVAHAPGTTGTYPVMKDRPQSSGPSGRRPTITKAISIDTEHYPAPGHADHYWNMSHSGEWIDGDLSRHKSDSDLQQSLLMQQQQQQQQQQQLSQSHGSPSHHPHHHHHHHHHPLALTSPQQQPKNHRMSNSPPTDIALWRRTNSASTAHVLVSPDPCLTNHHDAPLSSPLGTSATSTGAASSSLPDLTNIEFSSGLDEPLERDEPRTHQPAVMGSPQANYPVVPPPMQQQQQQQPMTSNSFFSSPPATGPGPSKLLYTSLPPLSHPVQPSNTGGMRSNVQIPSLSPRHASGFQFPVVHGSGSPAGPKQPSPGMRQVSPLAAAFQSSQSQLTKSPTMPDFRSLRSVPTQAPFMSHEYPTTPRLKPILPNSLPGGQMRTHTLLSTVGGATTAAGGGGARGGYDSSMGMNDHGGCHPGHAPMTIVIQSPHNQDKLVNALARNLNERQSSQPGNLPSPLTSLQQQQSPVAVHPTTPSSPGINSPMLSSPSGPVASSPFNSMDSSSYQGSPPKQLSASFSGHNGSLVGTMGGPREGEHMPVGSGGGVGPTGVASLPNTPTLVMGPGMQSPMLPSYVEARQQQALQEKFASINVGRNEAMIRSHSEENLQKIQKDKGELMQQNPFMGTLTNANSVPCVYVESQNIDNFQENPESPPTIDSPSTSASYASSPPPVRPFWMDMNNDFVFQEWALEAGTSGIGGGVSGGGIGMPMHRNSPPHHHRSLTDLIQTTIPTLNELSSSKAQQLSLPSVAMTDLTVEEHMDRPPESPSEFLTQTIADFEMDESAMELIKNDIPYDLHALNSDAGILAQSNSFFSSPDYFRNN